MAGFKHEENLKVKERILGFIHHNGHRSFCCLTLVKGSTPTSSSCSSVRPSSFFTFSPSSHL